MSNIKKVSKLKERINKLHKEIEDIQDNCKHLNITYQYKSNTGNWCEMDDTYWVEYECLDCGKVGVFHKETNPNEYYLKTEVGSASKQRIGRY